MGETELRRVERLTLKPKLLQQFAVRLSRTPVDRVAHQGMPDRRHVDSGLVGPAGLQPAFDQGRVLQQLEPLPVSDGPLPATALDDRDLLPVGCRTGKWRVDGAFSGFRQTADDRQVAAVDRM